MYGEKESRQTEGPAQPIVDKVQDAMLLQRTSRP